MLKTLLLVTLAWTAFSFLFCLAWSRLLSRPRALISTSSVNVPAAVAFKPWRQSPPGHAGGTRSGS
jgi:hypothetical protein